MKEQDYTETIAVHTTAHDAFKRINTVTKWWTENLEGGSEKLNDEFSVHFGDIHFSKQKLVEFVPDKKVVWLVTDSKLNFLVDKQEWTGTKISFEIFEKDKSTHVRFTHFGLVPQIECYDACSNAWSQYIQQSLSDLINKGQGHPTPKEMEPAEQKVEHKSKSKRQ